ncbi:ATP-binding protein [Vulcanococcus sp.]|uniref:ATP-binding protein n=1 Tax=Vulcanococcus sp. TaxID=2856995 RepID=UPI0037DA50AE
MPLNLSHSLPLLTAAAGLAMGWHWRGRRPPRPRTAPSPRPGPSDQQLREWIDAVPQGWLAIAPDDTIASANPRAESLLGCDLGAGLTGLALANLEPGDEVMHLIELSRQKGISQRGRWGTGPCQLDLRVLPGRYGWVGLLLQDANLLDTQLQAQERWVSDVAHELKTPLTALMLVGDSLASGAEGRQAVLVERLQRELLRLQVLVSDLLDLTRLDNAAPGDADSSGAALDPRDVLGSVWATLEPLAQERGVGLVVSPGRDQARLALVDPGRLHQALLNLLENALHYSPDGTAIDVTLEQRDRWCLITVRDHGPGLSEADLERMFQRFYRGDPSRARSRRSGSGLGLAIVKQIALAEGGLIRASNHPEGGAVLELLLPTPT